MIFFISVIQFILVDECKNTFAVIVTDGDLMVHDPDVAFLNGVDFPHIYNEGAMNPEEISSRELFFDRFHAEQRHNRLLSEEDLDIIFHAFYIEDFTDLHLD